MSTKNSAPSVDQVVEEVASAMADQLGRNLHSLILYGSAVRGDRSATGSDINLLVVLEASTAPAHRALRDLVRRWPIINPFIVERAGLPRAARVFALKFQSIRRNYRVLRGVDPLSTLGVSPALELFLTEQELRNFRMRLVHAYVTDTGDSRRYGRFVLRQISRLIIVLSDVLRCAQQIFPRELPERLPVFERVLGVDTGVLRRLLELKREGRELNESDAAATHGELVSLSSRALQWMEERWPEIPI
ncbi:MAG: nucleotidyltransferase domain-containing protein [Verrucomicrobia bacterium]|nr:nucleotidyltransferase domain-containing protein [Verrucomicrobiota bacterium]